MLVSSVDERHYANNSPFYLLFLLFAHPWCGAMKMSVLRRMRNIHYLPSLNAAATKCNQRFDTCFSHVRQVYKRYNGFPIHYGLDFRKKRLRERQIMVPHNNKNRLNPIYSFSSHSFKKILHRAVPKHYILQSQVEFLFYIVLLSRIFLVLLGWDSRAGNSKI